MKIKTFGDVDDRSLKQLETCMKAGDAELGVLCADHHPGYSQPIGGAIGYEGYISPSGVGYDIACVAAGTPVSTDSGCALPIEAVTPEHGPVCWDATAVRPIAPNLGAVARGSREVVRLLLENGRELLVTPDHRVRVKLGWKPVGELTIGEELACSPFVGCEADGGSSELDVPSPARRLGDLLARGLWPLRLDDPRLPSLVRLLAYSCGDGMLTRDGKRLSFWTSVPADAEAITAEARALGFDPRVHRRPRSGGRDELHVHVDSCALHELFATMGPPVARKPWPERPMPWLFAAPARVRASFLSSLASAEATTPRTADGRVCNVQIKQADANAASFVARLFESLDFEASAPAPSGPGRGDRQYYVVQLLGGEAAQLQFFERIGFCLAREKREAAAAVASVAWRRGAALGRRHAAWSEARAEGGRMRGAPRTGRGARFEPDHSGEVAWVPVNGVEPAGVAPVYDLVTGDPAESFMANGVVVHNCGNKAVRTSVSRADLDAGGGVEPVMAEIARRISFGMGVPAREKVDHPVLEQIAQAPFEPQRKMLDLASRQLGTVGSGNHFVNLFEDEDGTVWVGVHFGSRGFGHKTATGFLALAQGLPFDEGERKRLGVKVAEGEMDSPPVLLAIDTDVGQSYVEAMSLAGEYAYAGRDAVVDKVLEILGAESEHEVHNHHNFGFRESHFGRDLWVIRKGCTPARPGQEGFVGATMGDESVILEGAEAPDADEALHSTVHGAGRVMSRRQAAGRTRRRKRWACTHRDCDRVFEPGSHGGGQGRGEGAQERRACPDHPQVPLRKIWIEEQLSPGRVDWPAVRTRLKDQGIVLVGGGADEAPEVYKRLPDVLAAHGETIRVKHRLKPIGVAMAGRDVFDPYKD